METFYAEFLLFNDVEIDPPEFEDFEDCEPEFDEFKSDLNELLFESNEVVIRFALTNFFYVLFSGSFSLPDICDISELSDNCFFFLSVSLWFSIFISRFISYN